MSFTLTKDAGANYRALAGPPPNGKPFSVPIPGSEVEGRSAVYRHWRFRDGPLYHTIDPAFRTAHDVFDASFKKFANRKCLGERQYDAATNTWGKYVWQTYAEVGERRRNFGAGIIELHKKIGIAGDRYGVGIWCQNRPEWQIVGA